MLRSFQQTPPNTTQAEAEVMKRVRQESRRGGTSAPRDTTARHAPAGQDEVAAPAGAGEPALSSPAIAPKTMAKTTATEREDKGDQPVDGPTESGAPASPAVGSGGEKDDLRTIDRLLEEAFDSGRKGSQGLAGMASVAMLVGKPSPGAEHGESNHAEVVLRVTLLFKPYDHVGTVCACG